MQRAQTRKCTLETLGQELSRPSMSVDCRWSESHTEVTLIGIGSRAVDDRKVAMFYVPVTCTSKRHVMDIINTILDSLDSLNESKGGADL